MTYLNYFFLIFLLAWLSSHQDKMNTFWQSILQKDFLLILFVFLLWRKGVDDYWSVFMNQTKLAHSRNILLSSTPQLHGMVKQLKGTMNCPILNYFRFNFMSTINCYCRFNDAIWNNFTTNPLSHDCFPIFSTHFSKCFIPLQVLERGSSK